MRPVRVLAPAMILLALPLAGTALAQWEFIYQIEGDTVWSLVADEVHQRVYAGTDFGIAYLDLPSDQWTSLAIPGEDDGISAVAWHPNHAQRLILGRTGGAIELSDDLGATHMTVYGGAPGTWIRAIERDPGNPDVFYACSSAWGAANAGTVLRGELGGQFWTPVLEDPVHDFQCLAVDAGGTVYVGGQGGIQRSADHGASWEAADAGLLDPNILCLAAQRRGMPGRIYAGNDDDLFASSDGGDTWQPIGWEYKCKQVKVHPHYSSLLVAHMTWGIGPPDAVLVSSDAGANWDFSGYLWIAHDWSSLSTLDVSASDQRIYADNFNDICTVLLDVTGAPGTPPANPSLSLWPNPFNPRTRIAFELREAGRAFLTVHDVRGALVRRLVAGREFPAGRHEIDWDGRDGAGRSLPAGVYPIRIDAGAWSAQSKAILLN